MGPLPRLSTSLQMGVTLVTSCLLCSNLVMLKYPMLVFKIISQLVLQKSF